MIATSAPQPDPRCTSKSCIRPVSPTKRRNHFGQLVGLGFSHSEARNASGRCGLCLRKFIQARKQG